MSEEDYQEYLRLQREFDAVRAEIGDLPVDEDPKVDTLLELMDDAWWRMTDEERRRLTRE